MFGLGKKKRNHFVFIIFDSCRFDSFQKAKTPNMLRLGDLDQRYSYASWTSPSHAVYLMGMSPHRSPKHVVASEAYKEDFVFWSERLNIPDISFKGFVPELSLPAFLKAQGYRTAAYVSMPVLNQTTIFNKHFDEYELMPAHNDFNAIVDKMSFPKDQPCFYFLNIGETHYPYTLPGEKGEDLPRIHGVHGVLKHMDDYAREGKSHQQEALDKKIFDPELMRRFQAKQQSNVEYLDGLMEKLYEKVPANTYFIVTSDHGELFGEDGYFGHGPIFHELVFKVPFLEGKLK